MTDFVLYAEIEGEWRAYASHRDAEGFAADIDRYFAMKDSEGLPRDNCDLVLALLKAPTVVARNKFGLVKRALRHHDEIYFCSELVEEISAAKEEGATAVAWGADQETIRQIAPYDFGDMTI